MDKVKEFGITYWPKVDIIVQRRGFNVIIGIGYKIGKWET
jgi:hypothetical protein